jgi:hypothetical protein
MLRAMRWVGWVLAALLASAAARAEAPATEPATYALSWVRAEGAEECPSGRVVVTEIERRLGRRVFDSAAERAFEVEVTRFGATFRSDVFVRDAAGRAVGHRTLQSDEPGCTALVNATVLAIALVIDPDAAAHEPATPASAAAFEPSPEPPPPPAPPPPSPASPPPSPPSPPRSEPSRPLFAGNELSLRGELSSGLVPAASAGVELSFNARSRARWGVALSAAYSAPQTARAGIGLLDGSLTRAALLVTFQAAQTRWLRLLLGAGPSLGVIHVAVREPQPVTDPGDFSFAALQAEATLQVYVTHELFVEAGGSLLAPLLRQEFLARGQAEPVWRQPALAGRGFLGVGVLFR